MGWGEYLGLAKWALSMLAIFGCAAEIVLPGAGQHQQKTDDAASGLENRVDPIYHHVRGKDTQAIISTLPLHKKIQDALQS